MKKDKKARMKKLDEKYGIPYLSKASKKATAARNYYELFLESQKQVHDSEIEASIAYAISLVLVVASFWATPFLISGLIFLIAATHAALNARIERLWASKFISDTFDAIRTCNLAELVDFQKHMPILEEEK